MHTNNAAASSSTSQTTGPSRLSRIVSFVLPLRSVSRQSSSHHTSTSSTQLSWSVTTPPTSPEPSTPTSTTPPPPQPRPQQRRPAIAIIKGEQLPLLATLASGGKYQKPNLLPDWVASRFKPSASSTISTTTTDATTPVSGPLPAITNRCTLGGIITQTCTSFPRRKADVIQEQLRHARIQAFEKLWASYPANYDPNKLFMTWSQRELADRGATRADRKVMRARAREIRRWVRKTVTLEDVRVKDSEVYWEVAEKLRSLGYRHQILRALVIMGLAEAPKKPVEKSANRMAQSGRRRFDTMPEEVIGDVLADHLAEPANRRDGPWRAPGWTRFPPVCERQEEVVKLGEVIKPFRKQVN
ncbi:hypothetical protein FRB90_010457 [Tulasnella sp. 427]|nr:hypothetical protein FRB90_010457 [Tulasnella sp. 427]